MELTTVCILKEQRPDQSGPLAMTLGWPGGEKALDMDKRMTLLSASLSSEG